MNIAQHREPPDLIRMIANLEARVKTLETTRRLGNTSIDNGELTLNGGDIVVRNDNSETVMEILHGNEPRIKLHPDAGLDDYYTQIYSWEASYGSSLELGVKNAAGTQAGGKLLLMRGAAYLSHQPNDTGAPETYISMSERGTHDNHFRFFGKFITNAQFGPEDGIIIGSQSVGAGFGATTIAFDYALDATPLIFYTISGASANFNHCLVSSSSTQFTIGWSDALAHNINWIAFRT